MDGGDGDDQLIGLEDVANDVYVMSEGEDVYFGFDVANDKIEWDGKARALKFGQTEYGNERIASLLIERKDGKGSAIVVGVTLAEFLEHQPSPPIVDPDGRPIIDGGEEGSGHGNGGDEGSGHGNDGDDLNSAEILGTLGNDSPDTDASSPADVMFKGTEGDDVMRGYQGDDFVRGGDGNDALYGDEGDDILDGGRGDDRLTGGDGSDLFLLSAGNDLIADFDPSVDVLVTREGLVDGINDFEIETVAASSVLPNSVEIQVSRNKKLFALTTLLGVKVDDIERNLKANVLRLIRGSTEADDISRTRGRDIIEAGAGNDTVNGDQSDDRIYGQLDDDFLIGLSGRDYLDGGAGVDLIKSGVGHDSLMGGDGDDELRAYKGNDNLDGGDGDDDLHAGKGFDLVVGGEGNDDIYGRAGDDTIQGGTGDDQLMGHAGDDDLDGSLGDDLLKGARGDDHLTGGRGDDDLRGSRGNDYIRGQAGKDELTGGRGRDTLDGGSGFDVLTGRQAADVFVLSSGSDVITDFNLRQDRIHVPKNIDLTFMATDTGALLMDPINNINTLLLGINVDEFLADPSLIMKL